MRLQKREKEADRQRKIVLSCSGKALGDKKCMVSVGLSAVSNVLRAAIISDGVPQKSFCHEELDVV